VTALLGVGENAAQADGNALYHRRRAIGLAQAILPTPDRRDSQVRELCIANERRNMKIEVLLVLVDRSRTSFIFSMISAHWGLTCTFINNVLTRACPRDAPYSRCSAYSPNSNGQ
jgi:hypothetical protein